MSLLDALLLDPPRIDVWVSMRNDGVRGTGTQSDPYNGSTSALFDDVMTNLVGANTCVHLGPASSANPFQTAGYYESAVDVGVGWQLKPGMKIVGSGIDVTNIKLVNTVATGTQVYAFGHLLKVAGPAPNPVDFVEISNLTVDCNFSAVGLDATTAAGAVRIMGSHSRVLRVKIKNWGSRSASTKGYGISMVTGNTNSTGAIVTGVINCGIQECIADPPAVPANILGEMYVLHVGGKESPGSTMANGLGAYIRNCFVDGGQSTLGLASTTKIRALSMAWCSGGVVEGNQVQNVFYGGPFHDTLGAYEIIVRNNTYRNVAAGPTWLLQTTTLNGIQKLLIEGNTIELTPNDVNPLPGATDRYALGILLYDQGTAYRPFNDVIIQNNRIRYLDGELPNMQKGSGGLFIGAKTLTVRDNVLELKLSPALNPPIPTLPANYRCG